MKKNLITLLAAATIVLCAVFSLGAAPAPTGADTSGWVQDDAGEYSQQDRETIAVWSERFQKDLGITMTLHTYNNWDRQEKDSFYSQLGDNEIRLAVIPSLHRIELATGAMLHNTLPWAQQHLGHGILDAYSAVQGSLYLHYGKPVPGALSVNGRSVEDQMAEEQSQRLSGWIVTPIFLIVLGLYIWLVGTRKTPTGSVPGDGSMFKRGISSGVMGVGQVVGTGNANAGSITGPGFPRGPS